ncbi:AMP-binding protein [Alkalihalobacillus deserti]|uniref:AMP-binding protein n=1 Tax=Alkalihalobacillus deserti TaxID=2879466 RepID=UPI001D15C8BB|nr:AMP-binding protein [Alkalihalobacillus deserti]
MLICETIKQTAQIHPDKIAVNCDGTQITYKEINEMIISIQQQLVTVLGPLHKKKIAFLINNDSYFLVLFLAIIQAGAIAIPIDPKWSNNDMELIVTDCAPDLLLSNHMITNVLCLSLVQLMKQKKTTLPTHNISDDHLFYIGYTSGTTGRSKGYLRTHSSWINSFSASDLVFDINKEDIIFAPGALVHSHFLYAALHGLHIGATVYITRKFKAESVYQTVITFPITILYLVPTMFSAITEVYEKNKKSIDALEKVISAGAKWQPALKKKSKFLIPNAEVFEFYGASELSLISVLDEKGNTENPESVGKAVPGVEVSIRRPDFTKADVGELGKLFVKSKLIFSGYHNLPKATEEVFLGSWATVGDIAFIDEHGYITLAGREKNMIISGGLNIYPEEVEKVLSSLEEIDEVIVIGLEDTYWGEKLVAVLKWRKGSKLSDQQLRQHCKQKLATYKCPQQFIELDSFPYTTSQKIARKEVMDLVEKQNEY